MNFNDSKFNITNGTLWFHKVDDNNWDISSYKKVCTSENWDEIIHMLKMIKQFNSGMFFFMKNEILPMYEDLENNKGGYWSFKVNKHNITNIWTRLIYYLCSGNWNDDNTIHNFHNNINGISISPKINNCIIKIWIKTYESKNEKQLQKFFEKYDLGEILYKPHIYK